MGQFVNLLSSVVENIYPELHIENSIDYRKDLIIDAHRH